MSESQFIHTDVRCVVCKKVVLTSVPFVGHLIDEMYQETDRGSAISFFVICAEPCMVEMDQKLREMESI